MYCTKGITDDLIWVGGNDRRLAMFEGVYSVPKGVSYNAYLLKDDKTVLFDTVDQAVSNVFFENLTQALGARPLDYVVVQHMEPDHSATLTELLRRYPGVTIVCNEKVAAMILQFFDLDVKPSAHLVREGDTLVTGRHTLHFYMAPMVHWPEVMVTYDATDKILFSADAFGTFGALDGGIFADEVDFMHDYMDEARRYYCNIVGKYGAQVQALLKKASALDIRMICPLHGFVWREHLNDYIEKYRRWSTYTPEETGVMIAYASIYGNTANAAEILAARLRDAGMKATVFDVSVTPASEIIAAAFRWSHLAFASATYNAGIFVSMDALLNDLVAHNIQNRTVAFLQNGSWAPTSGKLMQEKIGACKNMTILDASVSIKSALKPAQSGELDALVHAIRSSVPQPEAQTDAAAGNVDKAAFHSLSYGLFVLTARDGEKDNGCIVNTVQQLTTAPNRISITVNKQNYTHDMILKTGVFNASVLSEETPFRVFEHFGFQSGRDVNKFAECPEAHRSANGVPYIPKYTCAFFSGKVLQAIDCGTHTLFIADVTESQVLSKVPVTTYAYYFAHIKPKPQPAPEKKKGWVCKICGYVYEGETLPPDFICPLCKHGAEDFEPLN